MVSCVTQLDYMRLLQQKRIDLSEDMIVAVVIAI